MPKVNGGWPQPAGSSGPNVLADSLKMGRDAFGRSQVFGTPVTHGDVVVIPVGRMRGGAGGGAGTAAGGRDGEAAPEQGAGHGWGMDAKATGAYVIRGGSVSYIPAVDVNRVVLAGVLGLVAVVVLVPRIIRAAKD